MSFFSCSRFLLTGAQKLLLRVREKKNTKLSDFPLFPPFFLEVAWSGKSLIDLIRAKGTWQASTHTTGPVFEECVRGECGGYRVRRWREWDAAPPAAGRASRVRGLETARLHSPHSRGHHCL